MRHSLADVQALDQNDPLAVLRNRFNLPEDTIYLDGNSLGALPRTVVQRINQVVEVEWGEGLIRSWNIHDWIDLPSRVGDRIARLIGAAPGTVTVADSTSINLFKALAAALRLRPDRGVILSETGNFSTDAYIATGLADLMGQGHELRRVAAHELPAALTPDVAVLMLTEVDYRTGARHDMAGLTARAHAVGALTVWDLSHSAGAFAVDLTAAEADFAVGCGYKYLNGGPGAPAYIYAAPRLHAEISQPLTGWLGHASPFSFAPDYQPAEGMARMRVGTPPILSMQALDAALDVFEGVELATVKAKADRLFELFTTEVADLDLALATPQDATKRGTQVSLRHPEAYAVMQALIARGVIGDFREPDILRFGLTPLYLRFEDVWRAAQILRDIVRTGAWDRPELRARAKVV